MPAFSNPQAPIPNPGVLADWLDYQQRTHPHAIELGLERVREVWRRLGAPAPAPVVITVGGTNGKGSTVAFLDAMLAAAGQRVGAYTSPHLLRYNERVRVAGVEADDATLVAAFARIEAARRADPGQPIALTYFEFGTLAALLVFADSALDVAVLEVGLGGRLDAVNLVDADAAIVTTVDLDHQDWLGHDRDSIGREKAGIFRAGCAAIVGERAPPRGLLDEAARIGAELRLAGRDFQAEALADGWCWRGWSDSADAAPPSLTLPMPALAAACQIDNAAAALAALHALRGRLGWHPAAFAHGVAQARIGARLQRFGSAPELVIDVAHNPQAARVLADWLRAHRATGRTLAVFGALADKDVRGVHAALADAIDDWFLAGLDRDSPRGLTATALGALPGLPAHATLHATVTEALAAAFAAARPGDRVLAFGSFFVAAASLEFAQARGLKAA